MFIDTLEPRRLFSVSLNPASHVLTVNGTPGDDTITMKVTAGKLKVTDNGTTYSFATKDVKKIVADGKAGVDSIALDASVKIKSTLRTGAGGQFPLQDSIQGGSGDDTIYAESDFCSVNGGGGNDTINTSGGFVGVNGGAGNDKVVIKYESTESSYSGGPGNDTIDYSAATYGVYLHNGQSGEYYEDTGTPPLIVGMSADGLSAFENFTGGKGKDFIFGDGANNILKGGGGDDYLSGGDGNDDLHGQKGNDTLDGGKGKDALFGGEGNDLLLARDGGTADFLSGDAGFDSARKDPADTLTTVEVVLP